MCRGMARRARGASRFDSYVRTLTLDNLFAFSPDHPAAKPRSQQTVTLDLCSLPFDQYLPSPRPSGGHWSSLALASACQGQWHFQGTLKDAWQEHKQSRRSDVHEN